MRAILTVRVLLSAVVAVLCCGSAAQALTIVPTWDSTVTSQANAATIEADFNAAAAAFSSRITSSATINIDVVWGGSCTGGCLGKTFDNFTPDPNTGYSKVFSYSDVRSLLLADAASAAAAAYLPSVLSGGPANFLIPQAEYKLLTGTTYSGFDATIDFSATQSWFYDPANPVSTAYDFVSVAEGEIDHALGRIGGNFGSGYQYRVPFDLLRYTAAGTIATSDTAKQDYVSLNGGVTSLQTLDLTSDTSNITDRTDAITAITNPGSVPTLSTADFQVLAALGATQAPEPPAAALLVAGIAGLIVVRRRRA